MGEVRAIATGQGWLCPDVPLPDDERLIAVFGRKADLPATCVSTLENWREQIAAWRAAGIPGTRIHRVLVERHGYRGSYSSVYRILCQIESARAPEAPLRLEFLPGDAAQVDFGAGPLLTDVFTGEVSKTGFFVMTLCFSQ